MDTNSGEIIDVLERDKFIKQVIDVILHLKENNQGMMFSIEGNWGIGKSFILDWVKDDLMNLYPGDYLILRYDCWKYDFYEEPLIALVANLSDQINELPQKVDVKEKIKKAFDVLTVCLGQIGLQFVKYQLGIDVEKFMKENDIPGYDHYSGLKTALSVLTDTLKTISEGKKVILMVDELDRCLPPYQIKVLERLHHLFLGNRFIVMLAVNPKQLEATVHKLYGEGMPADKYLKKIIAFSLKLDCGNVSDKIAEKYEKVLVQYPEKELATHDEVINFLKMLFLGLDIRTTEKIWEKAQLVHSLVFSAEEGRIDIFCFELLWLVAKEYKECRVVDDASRRDHLIDGNVLLKMYFKEGIVAIREGAEILPENMSNLFNDLVKSERYNMYRSHYGEDDDAKLFLFEREVLFRDYLVGYWCGVIEQERFLFDFGDKADGMREEYHKNIEKLKQFARLVEMMR